VCVCFVRVRVWLSVYHSSFFLSVCHPSVCGIKMHTLSLCHTHKTHNTHTLTHSHLRIYIHSATDCACVHFWFTPTYPTHCTLHPRTLNTAHYTHIPYTLHPHTLYTVHYTHIPYTLHTTPKHSYTQTPRAQIVTKHHAGEPTRGF
jgi:hypothetical protein